MICHRQVSTVTKNVTWPNEGLMVPTDVFGDEIERITRIDTLTGERLEEINEVTIFPATHYVTGEEKLQTALGKIENELQEVLAVKPFSGVQTGVALSILIT